MSEPWDRRPDETRRAFSAFLVYKSMEFGSRTLAAVAADPRVKTTVRRVEHWSSDHQWGFRVDQWDAELQREKDRAARESARQEGAIHEKTARETVAIVGKMIARVNDRMERDPDFCPEPIDVVRMADMVIKLHRLTLGAEPAASGPGGVSVNVSATSVSSSGAEQRAAIESARAVIRAWADRMPPDLRKRIADKLDEDFQAIIDADVAKVQEAARALLPGPPINKRTLGQNGEGGR